MSNNSLNDKINDCIERELVCAFCDLEGRNDGYCVECLRSTIATGKNTPVGYFCSFDPESFILN